MKRLLVAIVGVIAFVVMTQEQSAPSSGPVLIYSVPGVVNQTGLGTYFSCTAVGVSADVTVQAFDKTGSAAGTSTATIAANASALFGTALASGLSIDHTLASPLITTGFAQILSTSKAIICAAYTANNLSLLSPTMSALPVLKGAKQRGQ